MNIKLVIWDLDDTLWRGTLAEGDAVELYPQRAELIRALNSHGIVSAICSKNDPDKARSTLECFGLWGEFVFPRIAFVPKGSAVRQLIEDMQLRPVNTLFIDDNVRNLQEVKALLPEINIVDSTTADCDLLLSQILEDTKDVHKSRVDEYRILQAKTDDRRKQTVSNEEFLRACDIHAAYAFRMDMLDFVPRIEELINRSNQLNFTQSRVEPGTLADQIMDVMRYSTWSVFVWDKYGYYGLVGFMMLDRQLNRLEHLVFSCRVMHMGIEQCTLRMALAAHPTLDTSRIVIPWNDMQPDWITFVGFENVDIRQMLLAKELSGVESEVEIRVMLDCESGGVAHFSRHRDSIMFDNYPRVFSFFSTFGKDYSDQTFPPALVYGAQLDYVDMRWPAPAVSMLEANLKMSILLFCQHLASGTHQLLVILPPENLPDKYYRSQPPFNNSRHRIKRFNNIWREAGMLFPFISFLELSTFATQEDFHDASHFYPALLKRLAGYMDDWFERISAKHELPSRA